MVRADDPAGLKVLVNEALGPRSRAAGHGASLNLGVDTIAEKQVGAAAERAGDDILAADLEELSLERLGVLTEGGRVLGHEIGHDARVLGRSHRSAGEEIDDIVSDVPGADDLLTRREDINALADVGEGRDLVLDVDRANSNDIRVGTTKVSGGRATSISAVVSGSNGNVDVSVEGGEDCLVDGVCGARETPRHAHDGTDEAGLGLALLVVVEYPVHSGDGVGRGTGTVITENLDSNDVGILGNAKLGSSSGTGNVGTVTIAVSSSVSERKALGGTTAEDGMRDTDTSIDDVDIDTGTKLGIVEGVGEVLAGGVT